MIASRRRNRPSQRTEEGPASLDAGRVAQAGGKKQSAPASKGLFEQKIILEDESSKRIAERVVREAGEGHPRLMPLTEAELEVGLFQGDVAAAERFAGRTLRWRVSLMVSVGQNGLYRAVQQVAVLYDVLQRVSDDQRGTILERIGVNPGSASPLTAMFNVLIGLPDAETAGEVAVHAARTRHSKYAQSVLGARSLGIPPEKLAEEARKPGGLDRLAEAKREEGRRERDQRGARAEETQAGDGEVALEPPNLVPSTQVAPRLLRTPEGLARLEAEASDGPQPVPAFAHAPVAKRLAQFSGMSIQLVKGGQQPLEFLGRVRLPSHVRGSDPATALRWVEAALAAAVRAEGEG